MIDVIWLVAGGILALLAGVVALRYRRGQTDPHGGPMDTVTDPSGLRIGGITAVAFTASWCPYSRGFERAFRAWTPPPGVRKIKADISSETNPMWDTHRVKITPTVIIMQDGEEVWRQNGRSNRGLGPKDLERMTRESGRRAQA